MLAVAIEDLHTLKFPLLATPKLDGIRCLIIDGKALTRKLKPIPNKFVREFLEKTCENGWDGELMIKGKTFNEIQSLIMSEDGEPDFEYIVFDWYKPNHDYEARLSYFFQIKKMPPRVAYLFPKLIETIDQLNDYERECLEAGYEGVMLRSPTSPYKFGRSTLKEGYLLKLKRFYDAEAKVIGFVEKMHNNNKLEKDELGYAKRSSKKENLIPAATLGKLIVKSGDMEFGIGTGFDDALRQEIWNNKKKYLGKWVTYKYQQTGMFERPRFPVFKGFRNKKDM